MEGSGDDRSGGAIEEEGAEGKAASEEDPKSPMSKCLEALRSNHSEFADLNFWDTYYSNEAVPFDWYRCYADMSLCIRRYIPLSSSVLMVGCGNADLSEDMVEDGYGDIMNIDFSAVVINMMKKKCEHVPQLKYMQMDVRDMHFFPDESFEGVIDKGTLDSLMTGSNSVFDVDKMLLEVSRLLKPEGVFMMISYADPELRIPYLDKPSYGWKILLYIIPKPGFERPQGSTASSNSCLISVPFDGKGRFYPLFVLDDIESIYIYVCAK